MTNMCSPLEQEGCVSDGTSVMYARDTSDLYCSSTSTECACVREYHECMADSNDCPQTGDDLLASLEMCQSRGCNAVQCGLVTVDDPRECVARFSDCISANFNTSETMGEGNEAGGVDRCACTRQYAQCRGSDSYLNASVTHEGRVIDICLEEGCTSEECRKHSCGTRERLCTKSYMGCHVRALNVPTWMPSIALQDSRRMARGNPHVSAQGATWVQGPADLESLYSTLRLRTGKWYWEVSVSGVCGFAGVSFWEDGVGGRDEVEKWNVGMSNNSWAFGSDVKGLSLWHDSVSALYGQGSSNAVLAIALDADTGSIFLFGIVSAVAADPDSFNMPGQIWFGRNGQWVAFVQTGRVGAWAPALGRGCSESGGLSMRLLTQTSKLRYGCDLTHAHRCAPFESLM